MNEGAVIRIKGRFAQLFGIHFAQTFKSGNLPSFFASLSNCREERTEILHADFGVAAQERVTRAFLADAFDREERIDSEPKFIAKLLQVFVQRTHFKELDDAQFRVRVGVFVEIRRIIERLGDRNGQRVGRNARFLLNLLDILVVFVTIEEPRLDLVPRRMIHRERFRLRILEQRKLLESVAATFERLDGVFDHAQEPTQARHLLPLDDPSVVGRKTRVLDPRFEELFLHLLVRLDVSRFSVFAILLAHAEKRRLRRVDEPAFHEIVHLAIEEG